MSEWPPLTPGIGESDFVTRTELINAVTSLLSLTGGIMTGPLDMGQQNIENIGDWWSANWDGSVPIDLSGGEDAGATAGVAFDASAGALQALAFYGSATFPTGMIAAYGGSAAPATWVMVDGSTYDADADATYLPLYNVIGTTYGGTGSDDFQVPNADDVMLIGSSGTLALGATGGSFDHTHSNPSTNSDGHSHSFSDSFAGTTGSSGTSGLTATSGGAARVNNHSHSFSGSVSGTTGSDTHSHSQSSTGSNNPPYLAVNFIIKL